MRRLAFRGALVDTAITAAMGVSAAVPATSDQFVQRGSPLIESTKEPSFGEHIGLSADGTTMLVGSASDMSNITEAWVFVRLGLVVGPAGSGAAAP